MKQPLCIFPEGATANGEYITQFKKGAFSTLSPVQPFTLKYDAWYQPAMICLPLNISFFINCCSPPNGVVKQKIFPVFKPNEYFWKKHWEPV